MRANILNRMFVAAAVIGAVSLAGSGVTAYAQPPQQEQKKPSEAQKPVPQKKKPQKPEEQKPSPGQQAKPQQQRPAQPQAQPQKPQQQRPAQPQAQPQKPQQQRPAQPQAQPQKPQQQRPAQPQAQQPSQPQPRQAQGRLPQQQQQQRIGEQQQQLVQYRDQLNQQQGLAPQQGVELQRQHRTAQYGFQQQYVARLREQQLSVQNSDTYNYGGDPYFYTPASYRYSRNGRFFETNEYGATVLRQAVNDGYAEGFGVGQADRQDRWAFNYADSYAYQDGIYGYRGFYIGRDDYRYYFRQGFRRGYNDGYYGRYRYGVHAAGRYSVLGAVLSVIINLQPLR